jgi:tetratricopeptide (TPR) repeat protein
MNFGWLDHKTDDLEFKRVVLHEFGHALGFQHEHQHPEQKIPWNKAAVYEFYGKPPTSWDKVKVDQNIFNVLTKDQTQFSVFDKKSIMVYPIDKRLTDGVYEIPMNYSLSPTDINFSQLIYPGRSAFGNSTNTFQCFCAMFLFDLSGSMNENGANSNVSKLQQAKNASKNALKGLKSNNSNSTPEIAVLGFSGDCIVDPTTMISDFETDLSLVETRIDAMGAGGGTPLIEAVLASECQLANYLSLTMQDKGNLIVLSDGQATCQQIRPIGTYNYGQLGKKVITVSANQCGSDNYKIKYYTIGLNIAAGSPAERDLQYLSQISGGKYLNVQSQTQLERAFRKFNRIYVPKPSPYSNGLPTISTSKFDEGVSQINTESFSSALKNCEEFSKLHPDDCHGAYNLALMQEANDFYKNAITNYQKYLSLCPSAPDKEFVEKQIAFLEEEFRQFLLFQKEVVKSDLEYLKIHFDKIQNGQSVALAEEFKGFLKEKGDYYKNLSELTGKNSDRIFKKNCQEVALGLDTCAKTINRNPSTWDRDATPSLSMTYLNLERLLEGF